MREKPFSFGTAEELQRRAHLDAAGINRYAASGRALDFPITMHSATTDPVFSGTLRYVRENNHMTVWFSLVLSGGVGGSTWTLDMPAPFGGVGASSPIVGSWIARQAATLDVQDGWIEERGGAGSRSVFFRYRATAGFGTASTVGSVFPFAWAEGDGLIGFVTFEAQDAYTP